MFRHRIAFQFAIPLLVAACSSTSPGASTGGGASSGPGASEGAATSLPAASQGGGGSGGGNATVHLVITGGDFAGTYDVDITEGGCSTGATGAGSFAVASVVVDPKSAFDGPQITVYDAAAAASGTDSQFSAAFTFNSFAGTVEVNPYLTASQGRSFGEGTATLDNRGDSATLTIEGTTADGASVSATIECHKVSNF